VGERRTRKEWGDRFECRVREVTSGKRDVKKARRQGSDEERSLSGTGVEKGRVMEGEKE